MNDELVINYDYLKNLDENCVIENIEQCEQEIELIVTKLWNEVDD
jgi:hypothetical protein